MESKYTSLELSKKLAENGCMLKTSKYWGWLQIDVNKIRWRIKMVRPASFLQPNVYPAYDLFWDICVKHKEYFFLNKTISVLQLGIIAYKLADNEDVEAYIWERCKFNPKNKGDLDG